MLIIDLIPSMRLCLQWEVVRFPIDADTIYSVFIHGSTCCLYTWWPLGTIVCYSRLVIDKLSDPMAWSHWILIDRLLHSMCNWWTDCLLIFVWSVLCLCIHLSGSFWASLCSNSISHFGYHIQKWLDKHINCFTIYGWSDIVCWTF